MRLPILYSFKRCPYAIRARMALILGSKSCQIREVELKNKPDQMLKISPKGTVPVLKIEDTVIDESLEIISWAMKSQPSKAHQFTKREQLKSFKLIKLFDSEFKFHLDRYKYSSRFDTDPKTHRKECKILLEDLDLQINSFPWIFGKKVSLLDISILPFIRQCKIANPDWFNSQNFTKVIALLNHFENSNLFKIAMQKYDLWDPNNPIEMIFP
ncbi:MAG: glutathione S-transferase [Gammaproteobacteria bacterium]|nr:glutathione S-transferase [Gammaproteobacteria bacterium]|tara:strand:+ start:258 stop:896 length:639 start_codon:yes stop_codon:yes gene_type:complete